MRSKPGFHGADLKELALHIIDHGGPVKSLRTARRVRVVLNGAVIVDTTTALHVWEHPYYPQYYVAYSQLKNCTGKDKETITHDGATRAAIVNLTVSHSGNDGKEIATDRVLRFTDDKANGELAGLVRLEFGSMDQWLEEDTPIRVHPKDPFKRVDTLLSTRPIEIKVAGITVARSATSVHLYETGLPTRYYIPLASMDQSVLRKSDLITQCPYKGDAEYFHVYVYNSLKENVVWYYRHPTPESMAVAGMVCFYNEKVDILLDGTLLPRPETPDL